MLIYYYTFPGYQTHPNSKYYKRGKLGETDREGKLNENSSEAEIYTRVRERIKQQDNAAVSETAVILGYWFVDTPPGIIEVDDRIREDLITKHGAKVTRSDKRKTEWVIIPGDLEDDRVALVERAVRDYASGCLKERTMNVITLHDVQEEIVSSPEPDDNKSLHIAGCASGKTFCELNDLETHIPGPKQVNVLCTSGIELANQIANELKYNTTTNQSFNSRKIIKVHSGGGDATIDEKEIERRIKNANRPVWLVVVLDSVRTAARGIALAGRTVHMKVIDEVHRTAGIGNTKYRNAVLLKSDFQRGYSASYRIVRS